MPGRSKTSRRVNATLLAVALAFVQVCLGFTDASAGATNMPAVAEAEGCCGGGSEPDCFTARESTGAINTCTPYCIQGRDGAKPDPVLPVSVAFTYAAPSPVGWTAFPPHVPRLSAAPRAANSTPLIYQFQRLLN